MKQEAERRKLTVDIIEHESEQVWIFIVFHDLCNLFIANTNILVSYLLNLTFCCIFSYAEYLSQRIKFRSSKKSKYELNSGKTRRLKPTYLH